MIDGAQQCGILQAISGDIDGIIHRHSYWSGFWVLVIFVIFVLRGSAVMYQVIERQNNTLVTHFCEYYTLFYSHCCLKKNQNVPRPSDHPPVMGKKMSKRLGGIKGCKYKTSSWHLNRFPDADNIGSTV